MSSESILIISSYTISKLVHFFCDSVEVSVYQLNSRPKWHWSLAHNVQLWTTSIKIHYILSHVASESQVQKIAMYKKINNFECVG